MVFTNWVMLNMTILKFLLLIFFILTTNVCYGQDKITKTPQKPIEKQIETKCSCPAKGSLAQELANSEVAFVGQVAEVRPEYPLHEGYYYLRFLPAKKYKGFESYPNKESIVVFNQLPSNPCSFKFIKGNDYLVFAKGNPGFLKTSSCGYTGLQEDRAKEITELDKLR